MLFLADTLNVLWPTEYLRMYVYMYECMNVCMYVCNTSSAVLLKIYRILYTNICVISLLYRIMSLTGLQLINITAVAGFQISPAMSTDQTFD